MEVKQINIGEITPYTNNAKKHDETQINNVAESIRQYGFVQPLVLDKNNEIVIGHCRFEAAKQLDLEEVPCVYVNDLTPEQVKALRIVDNKTNESPWDFDLLDVEIDNLNFDDFDFDFILNSFNLNSISYIDVLNEEGLSKQRQLEKNFFQATFILPVSIRENFNSVNRNNAGKQKIINSIIETVYREANKEGGY